MKMTSLPVSSSTVWGHENPHGANRHMGSSVAGHSAGRMRRDEWSRGRLAPPGFGFESVPTRASSLLQVDALPKLTCVCAPPGYGKTVLLSRVHEHLRSRGDRCLWLSLDDRDRDVLSLLALLHGALAQSADAPADDTGLEMHPFADPGEMMDRVIGQIHRLQGKTVVFIDNLGLCEDSRLSVLLERLVFDSGPELQLVISSNREVPVDIVRVKLELGALELRADHLCFDRAATRRLLQLAGFASLDAAILDHIQAHTEGWPAAVRLLQVLMSAERGVDADPVQGGAPAAVLEHFGGDQKDIARVLTDRVLAGIEPVRVQFLMEIALVREFSAELAQYMTECMQAHAWLDDLVLRNMLIFPVDRNRRWFRFHTLLREYLLNEGQEHLDSVRRRDVLKRVAQWHASRGDYVAAIGSALDAPDVELAQDLIGRVARQVAADRGQMTLFVQWVDRLLGAGGQLPVEAQGWYVWALCHTMQYERARLALDVFDRRLRQSALPDADASEVGADLAFLRIVLGVYLDTLEVAHAEALIWLAGDRPSDPLRAGTVAAIAAMAEIDRGDLANAQQHLDRAEGAIFRSESTFAQAWVAILRALVELARARPDAADRLLIEARANAAAQIGEDAGVVATIDFVHARALVDLGRLTEARLLARRGLARADHHGVVISAEPGLGACVALLPEQTGDVLSESTLERVARSYAPRVLTLLSAQRVRRQLRLGNSQEAMNLAERCYLRTPGSAHAVDAPMRARGDWLLAGIELLIGRGMCEQALNEIDAAMKLAQAQGRQHDRVELLLAAMDAHVRLGDATKALRVLSMAIALACPGQLVYPFMTCGKALGKVLDSARPRDFGFVHPNEVRFLERLRALAELPDMAAPGDAAAIPTGAAQNGALPALTAREMQLLHLINEGLSNQQLADRLSLTVPTVKWHLNNLYTKIGVRSRSAALAKARAYGLLVQP